MHGDYQFANVMYDHGGPARLAAIVDWEMGTVGDPKLDLGWVVHSWPEDTSNGEGSVAGYVDMTGMPGRTAVLERYAEVSGRQVDDIDYYSVLAKWKLAVVLEQGFQRAGDDAKLQAFGPVVLQSHAGGRRPGRVVGLPVMSGGEPDLVQERRGAILILRLNRPEARNALDFGLLGELGGAIVAAEADPSVRAVVLTGTGDRRSARAWTCGPSPTARSIADVPPDQLDGFYRLVNGETHDPARRRRQRHGRSPAGSSCCSAAT